MPTLDFLKDQADWGEFVTRNVDPRAPNNVTTRARRNRAMADREAYDVAREQQGEADFRNLATRDRAAQSFYFGQQRMNMAREMQDAKLQAQNAKMQAEAEILPLRKNALMAQERSSTALERARTQAADFKAKMDEQEHNDTTAFTQFILSSGARRGTPEFANVVAEARIKFPAVPSVLFDDTWKMTGSSRTPEEVQASLAAARAANPNATITATERGTTITDRPAKGELDALKAQIRSVELTQMKAKDEDRQQYEEPRRMLREKIAAIESPAKSEPSTQRPIFKDKNGNRAYKNPDGTFEPIQ